MEKIKAIHLPNGRWVIENNGTRGKVTLYKTPAFWPDDENPELIGVTDYYGRSTIWRVHSEVPQRDQEWIDHTLGE